MTESPPPSDIELRRRAAAERQRCNSADRVREHRERERRGLAQYRLALNGMLVLDTLIALRLLDEPDDVFDQKQIEVALSRFTERALREARKKM